MSPQDGHRLLLREPSKVFILLELFLNYALFPKMTVFLGRSFEVNFYKNFSELCLFLYLFIDFFLKFVHTEEGMASCHYRETG